MKITAAGAGSGNIEDRRNDPPGATRFTKKDNPSGDITFYPPMRSSLPPKVLPYRDPEAEVNRDRAAQAAALTKRTAGAVPKWPSDTTKKGGPQEPTAKRDAPLLSQGLIRKAAIK